ncbi:MAG TPA: hypothetical protein VJ965_07005 [Anaerolineales bacterium]|nr:hypothetical protein [Anaerolineales bacterium]
MPLMRTKKQSLQNNLILWVTAIWLMVAIMAGCAPASPTPPSAPTETKPEQPASTANTPDETETMPPSEPTRQPTTLVMPTAIPAQATPAGTEIDLAAEITLTPDAFNFGVAPIHIIQPGQFSRVTSPVRVLANVQTGDDFRVQMALYGEDGQVLANKTINANPYDDPLNGNLITDMEFETEVLAEAGRLELKVIDRYGRVKALNSVNLVLLASSPDDRNYAPEKAERIQLQLPFPGQTEILSSPLLISGLTRTQSDQPLTIWLMDEFGNTLGETEAAVVRDADIEVGQFIGEIAFQVEQPTRVLMILAISDSRIPGYTYIKSLDLVLVP